MGLFKGMKDAKQAIEGAPGIIDQSMQAGQQAQEMAAAQQAAAQAAAAQAQQAPAAEVTGADAESIAGVSLEQFADVCKGLAAHGYDQSKGPEVAAEKGIAADAWQQALDGWNERIKSNPALAQQFNRFYTGK